MSDSGMDFFYLGETKGALGKIEVTKNFVCAAGKQRLPPISLEVITLILNPSGLIIAEIKHFGLKKKMKLTGHHHSIAGSQGKVMTTK